MIVKSLLLVLAHVVTSVQCGSLSRNNEKNVQTVELPKFNEKLIQQVEMILKEPNPHLEPLYPSIFSSKTENILLYNLKAYKALLRQDKNTNLWTVKIYQLPYYNLALNFLQFMSDREVYERIKGPPLDMLIAGALNYGLYPTKGGLCGVYNWSEVILRCKLVMRLLPVQDLKALKTGKNYMHYTSAAYTVDWLLQVMQVQCSNGKLPKQMCMLRQIILRKHRNFTPLLEDARIMDESISAFKSHPMYWCLVAIFLYGSYYFFLRLF